MRPDPIPQEGTRYEIIAGDLYVSHQPSWHHQYACGMLNHLLQAWSLTTGLGAAVPAPGLIFAEDDDVAPDVVWISHPRFQGALDRAGHLRVAPELVIEVLSPGRANARCRRRAEARRRRRSFSSSAGPDGTPLMVLSTRPAPAETPSPL